MMFRAKNVMQALTDLQGHFKPPRDHRKVPDCLILNFHVIWPLLISWFQGARSKLLCSLCRRQSHEVSRTLSPDWGMYICSAARCCRPTSRHAMMCPSRTSKTPLIVLTAHRFGSCLRASSIPYLVEQYLLIPTFWLLTSRLWLLFGMNVHSGLYGLWLSKENSLKDHFMSSSHLKYHVPSSRFLGS